MCLNVFQDSFISNLLRIIQHMQPIGKVDQGGNGEKKAGKLMSQFPFLSMANDPSTRTSLLEDGLKSEEKEEVNDAMAALEAFAPSKLKTLVELYIYNVTNWRYCFFLRLPINY